MNKQYRYHLVVAAAAIALSSGAALAANKVQSPYVEKGEWSLEHYGSYGFEHEDSSDHYEYKSKTAIGYGITDWWKVELEGVLKNQPGDNTEYNATELVNEFQFWEEGEMAFDMGLYTAYEKHRDSRKADKLEAILAVAKKHNRSRHTANLIFEQEIGSDRTSDLELGLAWQSLWPVGEEIKAGFEYYGELGEVSDMQSYSEQSHQLGPVVEFEIPNVDAEVKLGYLMGVSREPMTAP